MRFLGVALLGILSIGRAFAATDPFVGTWVFNDEKSPKPTIRYAIKDLGENRFALTGSTGTTTTIKADGIPIARSTGGTVSLRKTGDRSLEMVRVDADKMVRTYSVSADDKTLTLVDVFTLPNHGSDTQITRYARLSPGKGLAGEWQSTFMEEHYSGARHEFSIVPYQGGGLSFVWQNEPRRNIKFDGGQYPAKDPAGTVNAKPRAFAATRIDAHHIEVKESVSGKLEDTEEYTLSKDEKVLTRTVTAVSSPVAFISVFDRR